MSRSKEMETFLEQTFPEFRRRVRLGKCPFCGMPIRHNEFRDELSRKEFKISGLCQSCQDETFNKGR